MKRAERPRYPLRSACRNQAAARCARRGNGPAVWKPYKGSGGRIFFEPHFRSFGLDFRSAFGRQCVISRWA